MKILDRLRTSTLAAIAAIATLCALAVLAPYLPYATLHAQQTGPGGVPDAGGGGGGAVSSVFGRTGTVVAASGDYTAAQVTGAAATNAANTFADAQTFSGGYTVTADQTASFPGYNSWTIYGLNSSPGGIVFSSPNHLSNAGWIHDNVTGAAGFGVLSSGGAGYWWASSPTAAGDTALCRSSAGTVEIASGSSCNSKGTIEPATVLPGILYSAAGTALPTCGSGIQGETAVVSDAASPTYMGTYASGGDITAKVICSYSGTTYSWLTD